MPRCAMLCSLRGKQRQTSNEPEPIYEKHLLERKYVSQIKDACLLVRSTQLNEFTREMHKERKASFVQTLHGFKWVLTFGVSNKINSLDLHAGRNIFGGVGNRKGLYTRMLG